MINLEALEAPFHLGNHAAGNYTEVDTDGTLRFVGQATVWQELKTNLFGKNVSSALGKVDFDWDENCVVFASGGDIDSASDRVQANWQWPRFFATGTSIQIAPHFQWWQDSTTAFELTLRYRVQKTGSAKTDTWTDVTYTVGSGGERFAYSSGVLNQTSEFAPITIDVDITDTIQFMLARTDSLSGDLRMTFFGINGEVVRLGSTDKWSNS